ncbi:MAG: hypothetical protein IJ912_09535 [Fibrobacter sp.]|jgi:hypothetical protein|nr:hypothetical protein [Fibrobacter sp.]
MKFLGLAIFMLAGITCAQLVQKKAPTVADSLDLGHKKGPMVYSDPKENNKTAIKDATVEMDSRKISNDSTVGTLIGVGAEFVGDIMKGMLSPNSAETDAVELERTRR